MSGRWAGEGVCSTGGLYLTLGNDQNGQVSFSGSCHYSSIFSAGEWLSDGCAGGRPSASYQTDYFCDAVGFNACSSCDVTIEGNSLGVACSGVRSCRGEVNTNGRINFDCNYCPVSSCSNGCRFTVLADVNWRILGSPRCKQALSTQPPDVPVIPNPSMPDDADGQQNKFPVVPVAAGVAGGVTLLTVIGVGLGLLYKYKHRN